MNCQKCGRVSPGDAIWCAFCGTRLDAGDANVTGPGVPPPIDAAEATGLGAPPPDHDATRLGSTPPDHDATRLGSTPPDHDATRLGSTPPDHDATQLGSTPPDHDATRLGSTPQLATAEGRARQSAAGGTTGGARAFGDNANDLVGEALGARYQIIKMLGAGGMGAVYQAWDQDLSVVVALKTVRPEVTADPETALMLERRFKQELLLARQVTHKNIVRVHDMGEVDGIKYITMPYLEGEDLATVLAREGKLPIERVMPIARQVVSGLVAAHSAGVVHRDLKPANIMMQSSGEALIMDFGVARSTGGGEPRGGGGADKGAGPAHGGHTVVGSVVGTVQYMAPEQAKAEPVDQRADIYAVGLILYDLLLGPVRTASVEGGAFAELTERMRQAPPAPRTIDPAIPEALDALIARCIEPDRDARPATTADLLAELNRLDDQGAPIPIARHLTWRLGLAASFLVASLLGGTWWMASGPDVPVEHEPVSVLIADFQNSTGDEAFDRTLEPVMQLALETAGFISAYDRAGVRRSLGVRPPEDLGERAAVELAVRQGVNVVLAGSVAPQGSRYDVSVKAIEAVSGTVITTATERASRKEDVLGVATSLAGAVREALGDTTSDSVKRFAMETLSSRSIEAVREYAKGMDGFSRSQFDEALQNFRRAAELDPEFGMAYGGMAIASRNLDRLQDAVAYADEAMRHLDGMTERERFRARGLYYSITSNYEACVKEYGDLIAKFSADAAARNNRAVCLAFLRDLPTAVSEMEQVVRILPKRALYRENLALYSAYSGDFQGAVDQVQEMTDQGLFALIARAFAELGQGRLADAARTYESFAAVDAEEGPSYAASGLGDLAIHEGRYADAVRILTQGATADLAVQSPDKAASKLLAAAYAQLSAGNHAAAITQAERALDLSPAVKIQFLAGRVFVEAGATDQAEQIATSLGGALNAEPQAYAAILEGLRALSTGNNRLAIEHLTDANTRLDTWFGHFDLGRAYLAAEAFPLADSEFDRCFTRKGEALALFLDEEPTYGYFPAVLYYQGRVREGLRSTNFADSYRAYLEIRGASTEDPLVADARQRAGQ